MQRQGFSVTHEAGNTHSINHRVSMKDQFSLRSVTTQIRARRAAAIIKDILSFGAGARVVGDVSHVHSQIMEELLAVDDRVKIVFQFRETEAWVKSVLAHAPRTGLPETLLLQGWGIDSTTAGDRLSRLAAFKVAQLQHAKALKRMYPGRVHLVPLEGLTAWGREFVAGCGGHIPYSAFVGRNAS
jgi:hypothetical protein